MSAETLTHTLDTEWTQVASAGENLHLVVHSVWPILLCVSAAEPEDADNVLRVPGGGQIGRVIGASGLPDGPVWVRAADSAATVGIVTAPATVYSTGTTAAGQTSDAITDLSGVAPVWARVTAGTVYWTIDPADVIAAGSATWTAWSYGEVSSATAEVFLPGVTGLKVTAPAGSAATWRVRG